MKCRSIIIFLFIGLSIFHAQTIGVSFEASSFNVSGFFYNTIRARGNIKNIFFNGAYSISDKLQVSLRTGYGWNNFSTTTDEVRPANYKFVETLMTTGLPIEFAISFFPTFEKEHTFMPYLSLGAGYYSYKTKYERNDPSKVFGFEYDTNGFCQFLCLGSNIYLSKNFLTFVEVKHYLYNGLRTKWEWQNPTDYFKYEYDYGSIEGSLDLSISVGFLLAL